MQALTRRRAISRLGLLAGGAAAAPVLAGTIGAAASGSRGPISTTTTFDVDVRAMRPVGVAQASQRVLAGAVTSLEGAAVGWFHIVETAVGGGRFADPSAPRHLEQHTVQLPAGTIIGQGSTRHDGTGHFAVIGGTGAYHGASGSYRGARTSGAFGGDRATYTFSITTTEDADHGR